MSWIIGIICFLVGAAAGALLFRIFRSDEVRVKHLEAQLRQLAEEHENYKAASTRISVARPACSTN